jgi:adenylate cyclase
MLRLTLSGRFSAAGADGIEFQIKSKKAKALLAYLALSPRKTRSREEIMALLWSDRGEAQARASLRQVLVGLRKDLGEEVMAAMIVTNEAVALNPEKVTVEAEVAGEELLAGFHLHDPAFEDWLRDERLRHEDMAMLAPQPSRLPLPDKPSIAVLPFSNMSGDPEQEYFADGITEDIITVLTRFRSLFVIARNTSFHYKRLSPKVQDVGRELGVTHVVEGSVRTAGKRIRITVQLVEADTGHHVWAERYDRELDDIFDVQDEITKKVATELNVRLARGEEARVWSRGTTNIEAWEKIIRAFPLTDDHVKEHNAEAQRLATEAVQLDPTFITAVVVLGWTHLEDALWGWGESHRSSMRTALSFAERALQLDADNPEALALRGTIALFDKDVEKAIALCKRAVILSPSHAGNVALAAMAMIFGGDPKNGLPLMKRAIRLSPIYPQWYLLMVGAVHHINGAQQKAIEIFRECLANEPETTLHRLWLASALIATGQDEEAKLLAAEIVEIDPDFKTSSWLEAFSRDDALTDLLLTNLGKAGLPN